MFENVRRPSSSASGSVGEIGKPAGAEKSSSSVAGPTPFHRRSSWLPLASSPGAKRRKWRWHVYDNDGSYRGWFDWLPIDMRVGHFSPVAVAALAAFYAATCLCRPVPLQFASAAAAAAAKDDYFWWKVDCAVFAWGVLVVVHAKITMGTIGAFFISYTGWSWMILTARAGLEAASTSLLPTSPELAAKLARWGSSLRFPAVVAAFITFLVWNAVLLPLIYFVATPPGEKRRNFLKFNCGFFMMNVHVLNLPLAMANIIYGGSVRLFTVSDLWVGYLVVALYSALYLFVMDRLGLHFYPIFCPRKAWCAVSFGAVTYLYWDLMQRGNALILYLNAEVDER